MVPVSDKIIETLDVRWGNELVGFYDKFESGSEQFTYAESYLKSSAPLPISHSLPLREGPYTGSAMRPFFSGLLPEEKQRQRIASYLGISETDDFAFLKAIGGECAGALTIVGHGIVIPKVVDDFEAVSESRLVEILESLPLRPMMVGEQGLRLSLAGAQSKLPVVVKDGRIGLPIGNCPSTHILKPELSPWFKGIAVNEYCCMRLARHIGLSVPVVELRQIGEYPCLLVERYDRRINVETGRVERVHQEDFCQAMGHPPERKYQVDGGPIVRDVVRLIRSGWSSAPALDVLAFVDLLMFNAIIGNADAHGKNYSMLYSRGARRLAPGYDLVSTVFWPALSKSPAMKIGGCDSVDSLCYGHWRKMASELNLGFSQLVRRLREMCSAIRDAQLENMNLPKSCQPVLGLIHIRAVKMLKEIEGLRG